MNELLSYARAVHPRHQLLLLSFPSNYKPDTFFVFRKGGQEVRIHYRY